MIIWRRLFMQLTRQARSFALLNAGSNMAARMAIMAMTTNNSINVNALDLLAIIFRQTFRPCRFWFNSLLPDGQQLEKACSIFIPSFTYSGTNTFASSKFHFDLLKFPA